MHRSTCIFSLALFCATLLVGTGHAGTVTLAWDPNTESDLAGYKLYYGNAPRAQAPYTQTVLINDRTATNWQVTLNPGVYYFGLTAFDRTGNESGFSNEVSAQIQQVQPPGKPGKPQPIQ